MRAALVGGAVVCAVVYAVVGALAPGAALAETGAETPAVRLPGHGPRAFGDRPTVEQMTALGEKIFADPGLSASGRLACASCHSPDHAFASPSRLPAPFGGPNMKAPGRRSAPSLMYLQTTLPFAEHHIDDEDGHGDDAGPTGGLTWDGRVDTPHAQARLPLFAANEMAAIDERAVARSVRRSAYADEFRRAFSAPGHDVFDDADEVVNWLASALEVYQQSPAIFYPFTSKYDAVLRGQAQLDAHELRGLQLFNDPGTGNCASCHPASMRSGGAFPLFTDSGYAAIGVPRNPHLPANRDPRFFDLGLCGPDRSDLADRREYCGSFKVPSLRNVAQRRSFFHNGRFGDLREAVAFYATRDTDPAHWYPRDRQGRVRRFDDLPAALRGNVNREAPFLPLPGNRPRLQPAEIDDLVAFLHTLSDGYRSGDASALTRRRQQPTPASPARSKAYVPGSGTAMTEAATYWLSTGLWPGESAKTSAAPLGDVVGSAGVSEASKREATKVEGMAPVGPSGALSGSVR